MVLERESNKVVLCLEVEEPKAEKDLHVNWRARVISNKLEFKLVLKKGIKQQLSGLVFFVVPNNLGFSRFAVCVSKRNLPKAVLRNRTKRLQREAFRFFAQKLTGFDVVVMPKEDLPYQDVINVWERLCIYLKV